MDVHEHNSTVDVKSVTLHPPDMCQKAYCHLSTGLADPIKDESLEVRTGCNGHNNWTQGRLFHREGQTLICFHFHARVDFGCHPIVKGRHGSNMWFSLGLCGLSLIIIDYASFDKSTRKAISHDNCHQDKCHQIKKVEEKHFQSRFCLVLSLHYQLCWKPHKSCWFEATAQQ